MARNTKKALPLALRRKPGKSPKASRPGHDVAVLTHDKLRQLYTTMLHCRLINEDVCSAFQEKGLTAGRCILDGAEATTVGAIVDLASCDCVAPRRSDHGSAFILGMPLQQVMTQLYAELSGSVPTHTLPLRYGSAPLMITGSTGLSSLLSISTGVALAFKAQNKSAVVVAFSGDDCTTLSAWQETLNFAVANKLPIVHVVQDDLGSAPANSGSQSVVKDPTGDGAPTLVVDGTDVVAVYRVAQEAVRRARQGHGPSVVACKTHRWPGYAGGAAAESLRTLDPIAGMETYLAQKGLWSEAWKEQLVKTFRKQLHTAAGSAGQRSAKRAAG